MISRGKTMSAQDNIQLVRKFWDAFNSDQFDKAVEYVAPNAVLESSGQDQTYRGPDGFKQAMQMWKSGTPDMKVEITNIVAADTHVATEIVCRGTHTRTIHSPMGDIAPTNRKIVLKIADVWEIRNGKVTHSRGYMDGSSMMQQLGILHKAA
jgi:steroid delta-isomerase-like uncharacterized protein